MNHKSFLKSILVAMLALSAAAQANEEKTVPAKADLAKGEALYANGDPARNIIACVSCHGPAGNSTITQNPRLAGQHAAYLAKQLKNFTEASRSNPIMTMTAKALSADDVKNVTAFLNAQTPKAGAAKNKDLVDLGKKIYRGGIAGIDVPACAGCHGPNGAGIPALFPRLAGQHQDYAVAQLTNFRTGVRSNSPEMMAITHRMTDEEIKAVADYVAGLQ